MITHVQCTQAITPDTALDSLDYGGLPPDLQEKIKSFLSMALLKPMACHSQPRTSCSANCDKVEVLLINAALLDLT